MSCYNPTIENNKVIRCGECRQCTNRFTIFGMLGFDELSQLKVHPLKSVEIRNQITTFIDNIESKYFFSNYLNDYKIKLTKDESFVDSNGDVDKIIEIKNL